METCVSEPQAADRARSSVEAEWKAAVCQALAQAHAACPLLHERRGPSDERRCPAASCAHCVYAGIMHDGDQEVPICANTPNSPGEIVRITPAGSCPNFRLKPEPILHGVPPQPTDDSIRYIPLTKGKYAIVDAADYAWLSRYRWCVTGTDRPYACRREHGRTIYMHREIMQPPEGMCVDHIAGFTLDNRRANLRNCTPSENIRNRRGNCGRDLPKGVTWEKHANKYKASIGCDGAPKHIGYYDDPTEAAKAYDRKALELFGEFARLNFPDAVRQESVAWPSLGVERRCASGLVSRAGEAGGETSDK